MKEQLGAAAAALLVAAACGDQPTFPPITPPFVSVTAGAFHTCALDAEGRAYCWGANGSGQLGVGSGVVSVTFPAAVAGDFRFLHLSAGVDHTCGVLMDGGVACWGGNTAGGLGDGTRVGRRTPVRVQGISDAAVVEAGDGFTCALDRQDLAWCWGRNGRGQLGDSAFDDVGQPVAVAGGRRFGSLAVGGAHACAVSADGTAYCWGARSQGQTGVSSVSDLPEPSLVPERILFRRLTAGLLHTCGVTLDGAAYCWGSNEEGAVGLQPSISLGPAPARVPGPRLRSVEAAWGPWTCGITESGELTCWGTNSGGVFGSPGVTRLRVPMVVAQGLWATVSAGSEHLCGIFLEETGVLCWGKGEAGQIGDGFRESRTAPVEVTGKSAS